MDEKTLLEALTKLLAKTEAEEDKTAKALGDEVKKALEAAEGEHAKTKILRDEVKALHAEILKERADICAARKELVEAASSAKMAVLGANNSLEAAKLAESNFTKAYEAAKMAESSAKKVVCMHDSFKAEISNLRTLLSNILGGGIPMTVTYPGQVGTVCGCVGTANKAGSPSSTSCTSCSTKTPKRAIAPEFLSSLNSALGTIRPGNAGSCSVGRPDGSKRLELPAIADPSAVLQPKKGSVGTTGSTNTDKQKQVADQIGDGGLDGVLEDLKGPIETFTKP